MCKQLNAGVALASLCTELGCAEEPGWDEEEQNGPDLWCWWAHSALPQLGHGSNLTHLRAVAGTFAEAGRGPKLQVWVLHYPTSLAYPCWQRQH